MTARVVFVHAGNDAKGSLTKLELLNHLDGGRVLYKAFENQQVAIKVTWPNAKPLHQAGRTKAHPLCQTLGALRQVRRRVIIHDSSFIVYLERSP